MIIFLSTLVAIATFSFAQTQTVEVGKKGAMQTHSARIKKLSVINPYGQIEITESTIANDISVYGWNESLPARVFLRQTVGSDTLTIEAVYPLAHVQSPDHWPRLNIGIGLPSNLLKTLNLSAHQILLMGAQASDSDFGERNVMAREIYVESAGLIQFIGVETEKGAWILNTDGFVSLIDVRSPVDAILDGEAMLRSLGSSGDFRVQTRNGTAHIQNHRTGIVIINNQAEEPLKNSALQCGRLFSVTF